ncbi:MAG: VOC family protein [Acidimicrobiales bacterium]
MPYLIVADAAAAPEFYVAGFGAVEDHRLTMPDGKVRHAELRFGVRRVYVADEFPSEGQVAPRPGTRSPVGLVLHVDDVDGAVERARAAGATIDRDVVEEVFGARSAWRSDPFGHRWNLQQQVRPMTPAEMQAAINELA